MRALGSEGFESCPRSECRLGFLTRGNGFLAVVILHRPLPISGFSFKLRQRFGGRDYYQLKQALITGFSKTSDSYRVDFRSTKIKVGQNYQQFASQLGRYFDTSLVFSQIGQNYQEFATQLGRYFDTSLESSPKYLQSLIADPTQPKRIPHRGELTQKSQVTPLADKRLPRSDVITGETGGHIRPNYPKNPRAFKDQAVSGGAYKVRSRWQIIWGGLISFLWFGASYDAPTILAGPAPPERHSKFATVLIGNIQNAVDLPAARILQDAYGPKTIPEQSREKLTLVGKSETISNYPITPSVVPSSATRSSTTQDSSRTSACLTRAREGEYGLLHPLFLPGVTCGHLYQGNFCCEAETDLRSCSGQVCTIVLRL
ncbi:hypothetical protein E2C01_034952 [Portunus trituberculatus]|uniref:Uncharacterized protein n=1 Tax=Portunus trituberculatus TaxID=210409 RepID=A0A5B7F8E6_PORTR|nr:hypothetical protein [Portunus trituberculatus]